MKKQYIQPQAKTIRIKTVGMIASSPLGMKGSFGSDNETGNGGAGVLSRQGVFWDDDDE
ncbi:MAG: hypothetical protein IJ844_06270 [Prevotella sp.]|nr:hypothetical protein [Prevotella sp.]